MPRKKKTSDFQINEMDLQDARREFDRKRGRGSKYDPVLDRAEKLKDKKALLIDGLTYSEVTGVRNRIRDLLRGDFKIESTKTDAANDLYSVIVHRTS